MGAEKKGEERGEEERRKVGKVWVTHTPGSDLPPTRETQMQNTCWPRGFLHFISQLDEPNIFSGTHVMAEHQVGSKPTNGPTLDIVADYLADYVRKRQGDRIGERDSNTTKVQNQDTASYNEDNTTAYERLEGNTHKGKEALDKMGSENKITEEVHEKLNTNGS